ncbi:MAG: hypothetical protein U9P44_02425 [archaeon]|nr:hypothetical protein [archaeon]
MIEIDKEGTKRYEDISSKWYRALQQLDKMLPTTYDTIGLFAEGTVCATLLSVAAHSIFSLDTYLDVGSSKIGYGFMGCALLLLYDGINRLDEIDEKIELRAELEKYLFEEN